MELRLFVYGTLKRGLPAHARHCAHARHVVRAWLHGCLFEHEHGYPVLVVPRHRIHAIGTGSAAADALAAPDEPAAMRRRGAAPAAQESKAVAVLRGSARKIEGELMTFSADDARLADLDRYEGYMPGRPSLFARVLVDVNVARRRAPVSAWTYVAGRLMAPASLVAWNSSVWRPDSA